MSDKPERVDGHLVQGMGWSTARPTKEGWYWYRTDIESENVILHFRECELADAETFLGEWSGPIPLPTDAPAQGWYRAEEVEAVIAEIRQHVEWIARPIHEVDPVTYQQWLDDNDSDLNFWRWGARCLLARLRKERG